MAQIDITPGPSILGVLSYLNYEPWFALAEYVDNALQNSIDEQDVLRSIDPNYVLNVTIDIDPNGDGLIVIEDNAGGIRRRDFDRAFKAAEVPPDRSGLSEFGMGMKSASIWFARNWSVETTSVGDPTIYTVEFDMRNVLEGANTMLGVGEREGSLEDHFTRIKLWNLNQVPRGRTLGKIRDHMRDIYRHFLRAGTLRLVVANERMSFTGPRILRAPDVRFEDGSAPEVEWSKPIRIELDSGAVVEGFAAIREEGSTREAGFSLFRRGRIIVGSGDAPYRPAAVYGRGNSFRSQRLFGELDVQGLAVSHTKDGFQWGDSEEEFLEKLRQALDAEPLPLLKQAENYRSRSVSRQQAKLMIEATESTARSIEQELPELIERIQGQQSIDTDDHGIEPPPHDTDQIHDINQIEASISRVVQFNLENRAWTVTVRVVQDQPESRWLTRSVEQSPGTSVEIEVSLNASHPFVRQFALGDKDSFEAVLRIAVSLVVAECLIREAGLPYSAALLRQVNAVLTGALSGRVTR